jgi:hypothetical protein
VSKVKKHNRRRRERRHRPLQQQDGAEEGEGEVAVELKTFDSGFNNNSNNSNTSQLHSNHLLPLIELEARSRPLELQS